MRTLAELQALLCRPNQDLTIQGPELRLLIHNYQWSLLWNALLFAQLIGEDLGILIDVQKWIRFPASHPANILRGQNNQDFLGNKAWNTIWRNIIIPHLPLRDQIHLSQVSKYFFRVSSALYELKDEFPQYFDKALEIGNNINPLKELNRFRALAYSEPKEHLRNIFSGILKNSSSCEFLKLASPQSLRQWVLEERHMEYPVEKFNPLILSIILDKLPITLFFLHCLITTPPNYLDTILDFSCKFGAISILQLLLWAFPNSDDRRFDPYLSIACRYRKINIIKLLAPRVHILTLTMCLMIIETEKDSSAAHIIEYLKGYGVTTPKEEHFQSHNGHESKLMSEIIRADMGMNLSLFLSRWRCDPRIIFSKVMKKSYGKNLPLDVIAYLLSNFSEIQSEYNSDFSQFVHEITNSDKLKLFLTVYTQKWHVQFLPLSRSKMMREVCLQNHTKNFETLLDYGFDINTCFSCTEHVLSSPLSIAAYYYSSSRYFFNFLIEKGAVFTALAACHAIEGRELDGLKALFRLSDAIVAFDSLEYHPLFVAAQFGRLEYFDFLISQGITLEQFTLDQLWDFLIQGPIAGLMRLQQPKKLPNCLGPLYYMRAKHLTSDIQLDIGNRSNCEADLSEFPLFLKEKSGDYLKIISMILPYIKDKIIGNEFILSISVSTGNVTLVLLVLAYSPAVNVLDEKGMSCLSIALEQKNRDMVAVLLEYGANFVIGEHLEYPVNAAHESPEILALLINSTEYAILNFPSFPNKNLCQSCLPYLTEKSKNQINPQLAEILYDRYQLHPAMVPLQQIQKKIEEITMGKGWNEHGFSRITINNTSYAVPGIIAEIYDLIQALYKHPYSEAIVTLPALYQSIQTLARLNGFRLHFYSTTTIEACNLISNFIPKQIDHYSRINNNL